MLDGCGGVDDDCDGSIDEDPDRTFYEDVDGDSYGVVSSIIMRCAAPIGFAVNAGDCNDANFNVHPSAPELCNGIDDNCDGIPDNPPGGSCTCVDGTSQQCGPTTDVGRCTYGTSTCVAGTWSACAGAVLPSAETCNGEDDDCDGLTDDMDPDIAAGAPSSTGATIYHRDMDGDGAGTASTSVARCTPLAGYVTASGDCDDGDSDRSPTLNEDVYPCDGIDNDCDLLVDETEDPATANGRATCYRDEDGDTWGVSTTTTRACSCTAAAGPGSPPGAWASRAGDCQDTGSRAHLIHPGADFQTVPHCAGWETCPHWSTGQPACSECLSGGGGCSCRGAPSWEYNCVAGIERQPQAGCGAIGGGTPGCSTSPEGTLNATTTADCGTVVPRGRCSISCTLGANGTMTLGCR